MSSFDAFLNRRLLHFLATADAGNIHRAAETLGLSQPALTVSLRNLEQDIDATLFERSVKGVTLTPAGELFYRHAGALRTASRQAQDELKALRTGEAGTLRIGAGVAWSATVLPQVLRDLRRDYPGLAIDLLTGVGDQLAMQFAEGRIDLLLVAGGLAGHELSDARREQLVTLPMRLVVSHDHPLVGRGPVGVRQLAGYDWVGFYDDDSFVQLAALLTARHGLAPPRMAMRANSVAALSTFVRGTDAVMVVISSLASAMRDDDLVTLPLEEPLWDMPVSLCCRELVAGRPVTRDFTERLRRAILAAVEGG
ncbi:LysR family transcriptional regulator [Salipiger abyssi]|uniref:LysR family transcriptional regulator n=1 Tax=Salipiger abyssi TaxID=1250539 RepID=UPI001A8F834A|nr:LysR family transcriptional regulator [Salipiger abyssi]MBN9887047.1 LysR family transcriptional regulator [Salipiger abyssi]